MGKREKKRLLVCGGKGKEVERNEKKAFHELHRRRGRGADGIASAEGDQYRKKRNEASVKDAAFQRKREKKKKKYPPNGRKKARREGRRDLISAENRKIATYRSRKMKGEDRRKRGKLKQRRERKREKPELVCKTKEANSRRNNLGIGELEKRTRVSGKGKRSPAWKPSLK